MQYPNSKKIYKNGKLFSDIKVPFRQIELTPTMLQDGGTQENPPFEVYDSSGVFTDQNITTDSKLGIPKVRLDWIKNREGIEQTTERPRNEKDDKLEFPTKSPKFVAKKGQNVSQLHYAKKGIITEEMEYIAIRESLDPKFVCDEVARGRAVIPANINHLECEPMIIGRNF